MAWTLSSSPVGLGTPGASSPALSDFTAFNSLISPRSVDLLLFFQDLDTEPLFYAAYPTWASTLQATIISTLSPGARKLSDYTSGAFDTTGLYSNLGLQGLANAAASYGLPIIVRLCHEFNGDWNAYGYQKETAAQFVAGWKHVHDIFVAAGATNAKFFWCPNIWPPAKSAANAVDPLIVDGSGVNWYPGDAYVDIIGLDGYMMTTNTTTDSPTNLFLSNYATLTSAIPSKPFAIGEFGVAAQARLSSLGGKAGWYDKFFALVKDHMPKTRFACQWQRNTPPDDTTISSSGADSAAALRFVAGVTSPNFAGGAMADITFVGEDMRNTPRRWTDQGDGTYARVLATVAAPSSGSDKTIFGQDYRTLPRKLKDMGDGTYALTIVGG